MNILVIGRCLPDGRSSYGTFEMAQAKALAEVGHNVVYGYSDNRSVKVNRRVTFCTARHDGVFACGDVVPVGGLPLGVVGWFKTHGLCKVLDWFAANGFAPDLVYAHFPLLTLTEDFLSELKRRGIPLVCMEHWTLVQRRMLPKARIALLRRVVEEARAFCCVSDDLRDSVLWYCGDKWASKLYVVPNIVDEGLFNVGAVTLPGAAGGLRGGRPAFGCQALRFPAPCVRFRRHPGSASGYCRRWRRATRARPIGTRAAHIRPCRLCRLALERGVGESHADLCLLRFRQRRRDVRRAVGRGVDVRPAMHSPRLQSAARAVCAMERNSVSARKRGGSCSSPRGSRGGRGRLLACSNFRLGDFALLEGCRCGAAGKRLDGVDT